MLICINFQKVSDLKEPWAAVGRKIRQELIDQGFDVISVTYQRMIYISSDRERDLTYLSLRFGDAKVAAVKGEDPAHPVWIMRE